jgi:hypothetical protein
VIFKYTNATPVTFGKAYYLRFQPDKLMIFGAFPNELLVIKDLQSTINSIAFIYNETVNLPAYVPSVSFIELQSLATKNRYSLPILGGWFEKSCRSERGERIYNCSPPFFTLRARSYIRSWVNSG